MIDIFFNFIFQFSELKLSGPVPTRTEIVRPMKLVKEKKPNKVEVIKTKSGVIVPVIERKKNSYVVRTPCGASFEVKDASSVFDTDVVIDPGHGGLDGGGTGFFVNEKDINLDYAKSLEEELKYRGYRVELTRKGDYDILIPVRAEIINKLNPKLVLSIHFNKNPHVKRGTKRGAEIFYQSKNEESRRLGSILWKELEQSSNGLSNNWASNPLPGVKYRLLENGKDFFGILRRTPSVDSVLLELGFLGNSEEEELIYLNERNKNNTVLALADGIDLFINDGSYFGYGIREPKYPTQLVSVPSRISCPDLDEFKSL